MAAREVFGATRVVVLSSLLTACVFSTSFDGTRYRCGSGETCPSGYVCVAEYCVPPEDAANSDPLATDAASDASPDVSSAADATVDAASDAMSSVRFSDDFSDGTFTGWSPWLHAGCSVAEANGTLVLSFSGTGGSYCGSETVATWDLRTSIVSLEVVEAPLVNTFEAYVTLFNSTQQIRMNRSTVGLRMELSLSGQVMASLTVPDNGSARFWRIRQQNGTTYWETSTDGAAWNVRHSTTVAVDSRDMRVELAAGHYSPGPGTAVLARYDRVRVE
jgi:hypothetical protein